ncbi:MAG TPA: hypothetical protein PLD88_03930, partial [Candidatus Berkiella sp.]|nr:hypothetical protein [Candidatus Berkiella sp.]
VKKEIEKLTDKDPRAKKTEGMEQRIYGANNYHVMIKNKLCHDGILRDEVRIPGDNNCCYNAAIVAAKHAGIPLPHGINNHYELRQEVAKKMRAEYDL